ncbi:phage major capsid protein [Colidextribacter sp. OB.20]|uniref:phage major capsid protein n=1 Tax=Colidextribacter sp. OB.20 TaxID=2304568 RepID=UPI0013715F25|nr:phage major capsid protein [Colidextribacter sp. OB.20]NBI08642.1 phage major capsid protein [Colidextribacter sp. OB.20]
MTYQEYLELKAKRAEKVKEGQALLDKKDFAAHKALMADVEKMNQEIDATEKQLAEEGRFADEDEKLKGMHHNYQAQQEEKAKGAAVDSIRSTNEYAQAFAKALCKGVKVSQAWGNEDYAILTKALTETGGTPEGSDGGFLVPEEFDRIIHEYEKDLVDLSQFFTVENVRSLSGWRAFEQGKRKPLPKVSEMVTIGKDDQPKFEKITYTVSKYADRLPVSAELLEDNVFNLLRYLGGWFGPKYVLTKNMLLLKLLNDLEKTVSLTAGSEAKDLRKALIRDLNTAHSGSAVLLTNQNGYAEMDGWEDKNGRSLLVPNPADPNVYRLSGRRVVYADNDLIPDETGKTPIYAGNFKALGTLFVRKGIEVAATDVGGDAWATDSWEMRGICRMTAVAIDKNAAFKATMPSPDGESGASTLSTRTKV